MENEVLGKKYKMKPEAAQPPEDSKWSKSHFTPIQNEKGLAIFRVTLDTGRAHQIAGFMVPKMGLLL